MSILSIDIGLKNFAYCIVNDKFVIEEWCIYDAGKTPIQYMKFIDELKLYTKATKVIIEKQPTKNVKMKQFENMLYSYFIIKGILDQESPIKTIEIFNPKLKLGKYNIKGFKNYRERKKISIELCNIFITKETQKDEMIKMFKNSKKKDDLSDCLLQCIQSMKYDLDKLTSNIDVRINIKPRKPTTNQAKKGYSKSNLKYIFNTTNIDKDELFKDPLVNKAVKAYYNGSMEIAWKDLYNFKTIQSISVDGLNPDHNLIS
tara:strand:- start:765 stop:1541 length:777 start_codon:yes stop_codon:yes gene_type:complete